ncbi:hypothetical protein ACVWXO_001120 [Bradyrhizobium sp. LM2.7]
MSQCEPSVSAIDRFMPSGISAQILLPLKGGETPRHSVPLGRACAVAPVNGSGAENRGPYMNGALRIAGSST